MTYSKLANSAPIGTPPSVIYCTTVPYTTYPLVMSTYRPYLSTHYIYITTCYVYLLCPLVNSLCLHVHLLCQLIMPTCLLVMLTCLLIMSAYHAYLSTHYVCLSRLLAISTYHAYLLYLSIMFICYIYLSCLLTLAVLPAWRVSCSCHGTARGQHGSWVTDKGRGHWGVCGCWILCRLPVVAAARTCVRHRLPLPGFHAPLCRTC